MSVEGQGVLMEAPYAIVAVSDQARESQTAKYNWIIGVVILSASSAFRVASYPIITSDYTYFVSKWFDALKGTGFHAFSQPFADYAPLYLYLLKLLTFVPVSSLYSAKTLSFLFDIAMAAGACLIVRATRWRCSKSGLFLIFSIFMSIPTVVLDSTLWGQCDSIYASGVIFSLYFMLTNRPLPAVVAFGLALAIKVQTIFFLPVLVGWFVQKRLYRQLFAIPIIYSLSIVPALLGGGSFLYWFFIYLHQAGEFTGLSVNAQSVFAFAESLPLSPVMRDALFYVGLSLALACAAAITIWVARTKIANVDVFILLSVLCVLALPFLLPRMHERYFYLGDVLIVLYSVYRPRLWFLPLVVVSASFLSYMPFLSIQVAWFSSFPKHVRLAAALLGTALVVIILLLARLDTSARCCAAPRSNSPVG
jgi:Gpi18-like mannosyltransferase